MDMSLRIRLLSAWVASLALAGVALAAEPRPAQVAGKFYPEEPIELVETLTQYLDDQDPASSPGKPRLLIAPHAGYQYSGVVAGAAFSQLRGKAYDGVVVVGFTHRLHFAGASVDTRGAYATPLGTIPVHVEAADFLRSQPGLSFHEEAHGTGEHSLEVMLPFLQVALEKVRLVPVMMGGASLAEADAVANALAKLAARGDYLFVFSTDLSHYRPREDAETMDEETITAMLFETPQAVDRLFSKADIEACGRGPIVASLLLAERLGHLRRELLRYENSGDTAGNPASVVGYAALAMFPAPRAAGSLSAEAGQALLRAARRSVAKAAGAPAPESLEDLARYPELAAARGAFVTLRKAGQLRGCIGRIQTPEPLAKTVPLVAVEAALEDPRFSPVRAEELDDIMVEVSVLTAPKPATPEAIMAGRDGVVIEAEGRRGVFLPSVWQETGWTREEFLNELAAQKAGLPADAWRRGAAVFTFQDEVFAEETAAAAH